MAADDDDSGVAVAKQVALQLLGVEAGEESKHVAAKKWIEPLPG